MMAMVREINAQHLEKLETRFEPPMRVTCYTCHAGRFDPRPLTRTAGSRARDGYRDVRGLARPASQSRYGAPSCRDAQEPPLILAQPAPEPLRYGA